MKKLLILISFLFFSIPNIGFSSDSVTLGWDSNTESDLSFYRVYYGESSRDYGLPIKVEGKTDHEFTFLDPGKTYYFAVTAVDNLGNESGYSQEVSKYIEPILSTQFPGTSSDTLITNLTVANGKPYVVQQGLAEGSFPYYDSTSYPYSDVPSELAGATYIQTAKSDMYLRGNDTFFSFDLNQNAVIYVALDSVSSEKPAGMENFEDTGYSFKFYRDMKIYKKAFSPGQVVFGNHSGGDMYTLFVVTGDDINDITEPVAVDTEAPVISISSPTTANTYQTEQNTLSLSGTASDNDDISSISWANSEGGAGSADGIENWTTGNIPLLEGDNTIVVKVADTAGNETTASITVTYMPPDTESPQLAILSPISSGIYSTEQEKISLSGSASDNKGVSSITWTNNTGGAGTAVGTTSWSVSDITLTEGENIVTLVAKDASDNQTSMQFSVMYEKPVSLPTSSIELVSNLTVANGKPYVVQQGLAEGSFPYYDSTSYPYSDVPSELAGATYIQTAKSDMYLRGNDTFFSFDLNQNAVIYVALDSVSSEKPAGMENFEETGYSFKFYRDMKIYKKAFSPGQVVFGNHSGGDMYTLFVVTGDDINDITEPVAVDTEAPVISISSPTTANTYQTEQNTLSLSGTASDNDDISSISWANSEGGAGSADGIENWTTGNIPLLEGDNTIVVKVADTAGNETTASITVTYMPPDTESPQLAILSPISSGIYSTEQEKISLSGSASDNKGVSSITWTNNTGGAGTAVGTTSWSVSDITLTEGENIVTLVAKDASDNQTSMQFSVMYEKPVSLPTSSIELVSNLTVANGKPYVVQQGLAEGSFPYYDSTSYPYSDVPSELAGATYIQTAKSDMYLRGNDTFFSFDLNQNAVIYVALDIASSEKPAGMENFEETGYSFKFYRDMKIYKKAFSPGQVVFGNHSGGDMYTLFVVTGDDISEPVAADGDMYTFFIKTE